jgi:hypothetical protein
MGSTETCQDSFCHDCCGTRFQVTDLACREEQGKPWVSFAPDNHAIYGQKCIKTQIPQGLGLWN